jgi:hypothetical protein
VNAAFNLSGHPAMEDQALMGLRAARELHAWRTRGRRTRRAIRTHRKATR